MRLPLFNKKAAGLPEIQTGCLRIDIYVSGCSASPVYNLHLLSRYPVQVHSGSFP